MMFGTIVAASIGRVLYQVALTVTGNDNGYRDYVLLAGAGVDRPHLAADVLVRIADLKFYLNRDLFVGLALIAAALLLFSYQSWREERASGVARKASTVA